MKWDLNQADYHKLVNAVVHALSEAFKDPSKKEPQLVCNLVWYLPQWINGINFSRGYSVKSGGVFVHAQPFVKCDTFPDPVPASVEIGDLLLLRTGTQHGAVIDRRALLLQAKKIHHLPAKPDNKNQHHLYARWPSFEYVRSTAALNGKKRHVTGLDIYNAAKYLLIGRDSLCCMNFPHCLCLYYFYTHSACENCVLTALPSEPKVSHYYCFIHELINFLLGDAGKTFLSPPRQRTRNWDRVIEDLTTVTARQVSIYMQRASSGATSTRGQNLAFCTGDFPKYSMLSRAGVPTNKISLGKNGPPEIPEEWPQDGDEGGISIIEFLVESEGEKRG